MTTATPTFQPAESRTRPARTARFGTADLDPVTRDLGLLAVRLTAGLLMAAHGAQKLFGWWGGPKFDFIVDSLAQTGFTPARFFAYLLGSSELVGGLLLALGLLTPLGSAAVVGVMFNAVVLHWSSGPWSANGGYELPLLFGVAALSIGFTGPGRFSLDHATRSRWAAGGWRIGRGQPGSRAPRWAGRTRREGVVSLRRSHANRRGTGQLSDHSVK